MDLGKSFSFVFKDDDWIIAILVGGLLQFIPIIGQLWLLGYMVECARREADHQADLLPGLEEFGTRLVDGFKFFVITFVYAIPAVIAGMILGLIMIPLFSLGGDNGELAGSAVAIYSICCLFPIMLVIGLFVAVLGYAGVGKWIRSGSVGAAFRIGEVYSYVSGNWGKFLILWLVQILTGFVGGLGAIFFGFGALFTGVYAQAVFGNYYGQVIAELGISEETN